MSNFGHIFDRFIKISKPKGVKSSEWDKSDEKFSSFFTKKQKRDRERKYQFKRKSLIESKYKRQTGESERMKAKREGQTDHKIKSLESMHVQFMKSSFSPEGVLKRITRELHKSNNKFRTRVRAIREKQGKLIKKEGEILLDPFERLALMNVMYNFNEQDLKDEVRRLKLSPECSELENNEIEELAKINLREKVRGIREEQKSSIMPWVQYFRGLHMSSGTDFQFYLFVMGNVLKFDRDWLDQNPGGGWKRDVRKKGTKMAFPIFDTDNSPQVLALMKDLILYRIRPKQYARAFETQHSDLLDKRGPYERAFLEGDFRRMYLILLEEFSKTRIKDEDVTRKEVLGWIKPYTFSNKKNQKEKDEVAREVSTVTKYSRGFCIKSPTMATNYLSSGDLYFYIVRKYYLGKDGKEKFVEVPEIAFHVFHDGRINPNEIHGDGENQNIKPGYLSIAREFVMQKRFGANGQQTNEYLFKNAEEVEIKFLDTELLNQIQTQIQRMVKLNNNGVRVEQGGEYDLNERELKFLHEIYRPPYLFTVGNAWGSAGNKQLRNLCSLRNSMFVRPHKEYHVGVGPYFYLNDYAKMFQVDARKILDIRSMDGRSGTYDDLNDEVELMMVLFTTDFDFGKYKEKFGTRLPQNLKVICSNAGLMGITDLANLEEVTGSVKFYTQTPTLTSLGKLRKISGIELTDQDKQRILSGELKEFPPLYKKDEDINSRITKVKY
jgi:hypothetical protein